MRAHIAEIARVADTLVCAYPNAGLPNEFGDYDESPEDMAELLGEFADAGLVNIVGGCCGTTPEHIRAIAAGGRRQGAAHNPRDRRRSCGCPGSSRSTLTPDTIPFVNVGERTNVTGSAKFRKLITAGDYAAALDVAREQVENGAQIIDVNMDEGLLDSEKAMVTFLNLIAAEPDIARVPVMIDSSKWSVIEAGLKCVQGKAVVNSISMKEGEDGFHRARQDSAPLRRRGGGDGVRRAGPGRHLRAQDRDLPARLRHSGQPGRLPAGGHHLRSRTSSPVATGIEEHNNYGVDFIEATRWITREPAARACLGRRLEPVVLVPRQRAGARGDAFGVPLSRHQGRHGYGHRQCRAAGGL